MSKVAAVSCCGLSLLLHGLILPIATGVVEPQSGRPGHAGGRAVSTRLPPSAIQARRAVEVMTIEPAHPVEPHVPVRRSPDPAPAATSMQAPAPDLQPLADSAGQDGDGDYFPRSMLSVAPVPVSVVVIPFPEVEGPAERYVTRLLLFIDEFGKVVRVRVDGPSLPQALEEAARNAFLNARFSPGQVDGLAVRSRIRVEVTFEAANPKR
ncbi:energy transducer TonB [Piscinibacter sp.]|jgi:TonB family protein|uniref:energy transducer TonB n=1 Tax=Piscinibacter sp. TaxID=1903157 RepID=UPI00355AB88F